MNKSLKLSDFYAENAINYSVGFSRRKSRVALMGQTTMAGIKTRLQGGGGETKVAKA